MLSFLRRRAALGLLSAAVLAGSVSAACDAGKRDDQKTVGPAILVVGTNVDATHPMPVDGAIQVAFDRYLLPSTVNRSSFVLRDGANKLVAPDLLPVVVYDPITRTVTLLPPKQPWLTEGQPYKLVLVRTGNIGVRELKELFAKNLPTIERALAKHSLVELDRKSVRVVV